MPDDNDQLAGWAVLLAQLPASPSSSRVYVWRRARAAGAIGVQNGAWVLPAGPAHERFFTELADAVRSRGGSALYLTARTASPAADEELVARFRSDRAKEYTELAERCTALLGELNKESQRSNFSFAEMEENEQVLDRLHSWLDKITARDFFPDDHAKDAAETLERCRQALHTFTGEVYRAEGITHEAPDGL